MANYIKPIAEMMAPKADNTIDGSIEGLLKTFNRDIRAGTIRIKNVTEFTRLLQAYMQLEMHKKMNPGVKTEEFKLPELLDESEIESLYQKLFEGYNSDNDKKNEGG